MWTQMVRAALGGVATLVLLGAAPQPVLDSALEPWPAVTAQTLDDRYRANQEAVEEELAKTAAPERAAVLRSLRERQLLAFDPAGTGIAVEVVGDLLTADRIAVLVPGADTTLDKFDRPRGPGSGAHALLAGATEQRPETQVAAVAWLGYHPPQGAGPAVASDRVARAAAQKLRGTVTLLRELNPTAAVSLLCHSYGAVVCGLAAPDLPVADLVFYGAPGVGVANRAELATAARVWAGRSERDWIRFVPSGRWAGWGLGADPVAPSFGAQIFPAGVGGHGDYHLPGSPALASLIRIVLGEPLGGGAQLAGVGHG